MKLPDEIHGKIGSSESGVDSKACFYFDSAKVDTLPGWSAPLLDMPCIICIALTSGMILMFAWL